MITVWVIIFAVFSLFLGYFLERFSGKDRFFTVVLSGVALSMMFEQSGLSPWTVMLIFIVGYLLGRAMRDKIEKI